MIYVQAAFWALAAVLSLRASKALYGSQLAPMGLFSAVWCVVFSLYSLRLYPFNDVSWFVWAYFLGSLVVFLFVSFFIASVYNARGFKRGTKDIPARRLWKATLISFLLGMIGFLVLFTRIVMKYGFSAFLEDQESVHADFTVQFVGYLYLFNGITPVLAYMHYKKFKRNRGLMLVLITASLATLLFSVSRTNMLRSFVMIYLALVYAGLLKVKLRNLAVLGVLAVSFFIGYHYYKNPYLAESLEKDNTFRPTELVMLAPTYGYIVAPFAVFEQRAGSLPDYEWGINTFNTPARFIKLFYEDMTVRALGQDTGYQCNGICSNVFTYLDVYYRDFGATGVFAFVLIQALLVNIAYSEMRWRNKPELFMLNAVIGWSLLISFFSNHFTKNSTVFFLIVCYVVGKYLYRKVPSRTHELT